MKPSKRTCAPSSAAIYVRRSTEEHQEASLETQRSEALRYCQAKGWHVSDDHVFVDDAVSRAEFKKRPGLIRLLNASRDGLFAHVVTRDETRLGGDVNRTGLVIQDLADAGVQLVYYFTDEVVSVEGAVDKFLVAARNFASELEREKISQRTHEHLLKKAREGLPAGGLAYGYLIENEPKKHYVVHPIEAEIVRRIFRMYADGDGQRTIAGRLNEEGIPSPRQGKRGTGSWSPSAVRAILKSPRYMGTGTYNRTQKLYRGGTKIREARPHKAHVSYPTPVVVDADLWAAVEARFAGNARFGRVRSTKGAKPRHLLSGIGRCAECGVKWTPIFGPGDKVDPAQR
jgi:DNA invertase Pin-like site-specific DNA recombinase